MRIKVFNSPKLCLFSWVELGAGLSITGGLLLAYYPL